MTENIKYSIKYKNKMQTTDYYTEKERNKDYWNCNRNLSHTLRDNRLSYIIKQYSLHKRLNLSLCYPLFIRVANFVRG